MQKGFTLLRVATIHVFQSQHRRITIFMGPFWSSGSDHSQNSSAILDSTNLDPIVFATSYTEVRAKGSSQTEKSAAIASYIRIDWHLG